jgi:hypothetical protein
MNIIMQRTKNILEHPLTNISLGGILLFTSFSEIFSELTSSDDVSLGAHHGLGLYAVIHILKALPDLFASLDYLTKIKKQP